MAREPHKTLDEQIEGDHAYRDEPPKRDPREGMDDNLLSFIEHAKDTPEAPDVRIDRAGRVIVNTIHIHPPLSQLAAHYDVQLIPKLGDFGCDCCGSYVEHIEARSA